MISLWRGVDLDGEVELAVILDGRRMLPLGVGGCEEGGYEWMTLMMDSG
jgi:hypothetical protein